MIKTAGVMMVVAALVGGCGDGQASAATEVVELVPVNQDGSLPDGWETAVSYDGDCFGRSGAVQRDDAFRCMTSDSEIFDPCFAAGSASDVLACEPDPWARTVSLLTAASMPWDDPDYAPITTQQPPAADRTPWLIEVADDDGDPVPCWFAGGAGESIAGRRVDFYCENDWELLAIVRTEDQWQVELVDGDRIVTAPVLRAWV